MLYAIKREEVGNLVYFGIFDNIAPDDLLPPRLVLVKEPVVNFFPVENLNEVKPIEIAVHEIINRIYVLFLHGTDIRYEWLTGQGVPLDLLLSA